MMRSRRALAIGNGVGCLLSALVLASGIIWYPLIELAVQYPLASLSVVVVGIWLAAIWPARLALGVGNAAVIAGFAGIWLLFGLPRAVEINPILFFGVALLIAFGYALAAVSLARGIVARGTRPA